MPRTLFILVALVATLLHAPSGSAQTLKLGTLASEGSPWHDLLVDIGESWKAASGGRVRSTSMPAAAEAATTKAP